METTFPCEPLQYDWIIFHNYNSIFLCRFERNVNIKTAVSATSQTAPFWHRLHHSDKDCTILTQTAPFWHRMHHSDTDCTILTQNAPFWHRLHHSDKDCTILTQNAPFWHRLHHSDTDCTILTQTAPFWHRLHHSDTECTILTQTAPFWHRLHHSGIECTILTQTAPFWHRLHHSDTDCTILTLCNRCIFVCCIFSKLYFPFFSQFSATFRIGDTTNMLLVLQHSGLVTPLTCCLYCNIQNWWHH